MDTGKYLTQASLLAIRKFETQTFRFTQALTEDYINDLNPDLKLPIIRMIRHEEKQRPPFPVVRCAVTIPRDPQHQVGDSVTPSDIATALVDMPLAFYEKLPKA